MTTTRRLIIAAWLLGAAVLASSTGASAQVARADSAAVLLAAANGFEASGKRELADAIYQHLLEHYGGTAAAAAAQERRAHTRVAGLEGAGRVELQVWSTSYGLLLGVLVPMAFNASEPEPYGVGLLLGGPGGFLAGRSIAGSRPLTEGQARAITWGGMWGTWQGFGWAHALDLGVTRECHGGYCWESDPRGEVIARAMIAGGLAGIAAGSALSRRTISPGTATAASLGSLWGTWFGFALGVLADQEGDGLLGTALVGGNAGLFATALLAPGWNASRGRVRLVNAAGLVGGVAGLGLDLIVQPDDEKVAVAIPLATSLLGLALGVSGTRDHDQPSRGVDQASSDGRGSALGPAPALFSLSEGAWAVGAPLPMPVPTEVEGPRGYRRGTALALPLLKMAF